MRETSGWLRVLREHPFILVAKSWQTNLYPSGLRKKWQLGKENVPQGLKPGSSQRIYGMAEPVPFQDRLLTHALKPDVFSIIYGPTKAVP